MSVAGFGPGLTPDLYVALEVLLAASQRTPPCKGCPLCDAAREVVERATATATATAVRNLLARLSAWEAAHWDDFERVVVAVFGLILAGLIVAEAIGRW